DAPQLCAHVAASGGGRRHRAIDVLALMVEVKVEANEAGGPVWLGIQVEAREPGSLQRPHPAGAFGVAAVAELLELGGVTLLKPDVDRARHATSRGHRTLVHGTSSGSA